MAVFGGRKQDVVVIDCAYPVDGVVATYSRCVDDSVDWVIGPLSRADVTRAGGGEAARGAPTRCCRRWAVPANSIGRAGAGS